MNTALAPTPIEKDSVPYYQFQELVRTNISGNNDLNVVYKTLARIVVDGRVTFLLDQLVGQRDMAQYVVPGGTVTLPKSRLIELKQLTDARSRMHKSTRRVTSDQGEPAELAFSLPPDYTAATLSWLRKLSYKEKDPKGQIGKSLALIPGLVPAEGLANLTIHRAGYSAELRRWTRHGDRTRLVLADIWEPELSGAVIDNIKSEAANSFHQVLLAEEGEIPDLVRSRCVSRAALSLLNYQPQFTFPTEIKDY